MGISGKIAVGCLPKFAQGRNHSVNVNVRRQNERLRPHSAAESILDEVKIDVVTRQDVERAVVVALRGLLP